MAHIPNCSVPLPQNWTKHILCNVHDFLLSNGRFSDGILYPMWIYKINQCYPWYIKSLLMVGSIEPLLLYTNMHQCLFWEEKGVEVKCCLFLFLVHSSKPWLLHVGSQLFYMVMSTIGNISQELISIVNAHVNAH